METLYYVHVWSRKYYDTFFIPKSEVQITLKRHFDLDHDPYTDPDGFICGEGIHCEVHEVALGLKFDGNI